MSDCHLPSAASGKSLHACLFNLITKTQSRVWYISPLPLLCRLNIFLHIETHELSYLKGWFNAQEELKAFLLWGFHHPDVRVLFWQWRGQRTWTRLRRLPVSLWSSASTYSRPLEQVKTSKGRHDSAATNTGALLIFCFRLMYCIIQSVQPTMGDVLILAAVCRLSINPTMQKSCSKAADIETVTFIWQPAPPKTYSVTKCRRLIFFFFFCDLIRNLFGRLSVHLSALSDQRWWMTADRCQSQLFLRCRLPQIRPCTNLKVTVPLTSKGPL